MRSKITEHLIHTFIDETKQKFQSSDYSSRIKNILKNMPVNIRFNNRFRITYGEAIVVPRYSRIYKNHRKAYNLSTKTANFYRGGILNDMDYYPVMSLNPSLLQTRPKSEGLDTISHELAHLLDFFIRGTSYHDDHWKKLHKAMGGSGETYWKIDMTEIPTKETQT